MTLNSVREYIQVMRKRYLKADRKEKGHILDECIKVTGYHRKAMIRVLLKIPRPTRYRGRPPNGVEVKKALKEIWKDSDRLCSKRLQPFIPEMIQVLRREGELQINAVTEAQLTKLSTATIDRMLKSHRNAGGRKPLSTTQPGNLLKNSRLLSP